MKAHEGRPSAQQLTHVEHLVDTQNMSYDQARRAEGLPTPDYEMFSADRIRARIAAHQRHVELYGVPDDPTPPELTADQQASIAESVAEAHSIVRGIGNTALGN